MANPPSRGPVERWYRKHGDAQGPYAAYAGFESDLRADDVLAAAYDEMDVYAKIQLFAFVCRLLEEMEGDCLQEGETNASTNE